MQTKNIGQSLEDWFWTISRQSRCKKSPLTRARLSRYKRASIAKIKTIKVAARTIDTGTRGHLLHQFGGCFSQSAGDQSIPRSGQSAKRLGSTEEAMACYSYKPT